MGQRGIGELFLIQISMSTKIASLPAIWMDLIMHWMDIAFPTANAAEV